MRRLLGVSLFAIVISTLAPSASYAQQQSVSVYLGGFVPSSYDSRTSSDVLVNNLNFLTFNLNEFNTFTFGGEWQFPLSRIIDASVGVGYSSSSTPSVYTDYVADDQSEISQELRLRIVPFTAMIRLVPFGHASPIQPYVGAGVGIFSWKYSESGQFIDFSDGSLFRDSFVGSGATAGPVIVGGVTFQPGNFGFGGEIRWQSAQGELPSDQFFSGNKIDLGGFTYSATFKVKF